MKGFWNDPEGLSIAELTILAALPPWIYTAYRFALATDLSANQVDFFLVLTYPLLVVLGGKLLGYLPQLGRRRVAMNGAIIEDKDEERRDNGATI
ncbi:MAG: hypothetical protein ACPLRW_07830 [Moorellales bacterium]